MYVLLVRTLLGVEYAVLANNGDVAIIAERIERALGSAASDYSIVPFNVSTVADIEADTELADKL